MNQIVKNRTIRPSSRQSTSTNYKIDTSRVSRYDILIVNIDHESKPFRASYRFNGVDIASKNSISFRVYGSDNNIMIKWSGAVPIESFNTPDGFKKGKKKPRNYYRNVPTQFEESSSQSILRSDKTGRIIRCTKCKSVNLKISGHNDSLINGVLGGIIAGIPGFFAGLMDNRLKLKCLECGNDWKTKMDIRYSVRK